MYRFLLSPRWLGGTAVALVAIVVCLWLGSWQLSRFEARASSHHGSASTAAGPPVSLDGVLTAASPLVGTDTVGKPVSATGRYDQAHQLLVPDRTLDGRQGYYVLTPLRTADGRAVAVVRGWAPGAPGQAAAPAVPAAPAGEQTVSGRLQAPESSGSNGAVAGGLPTGQLGTISPAALVNLLPYPVYDGWIASDQPAAGLTAVPTVQPQGGDGLSLRAFQNLGYTLEWFVFAAFVVFMWFRLVRREAEAVEDRRLGLA
ncbi:SURF1 family protein [Kitasatospora sp. MMS16-BH015]|uniref:SURF1 family protein n=1 Tax=Kitasatospora sp. MMS16-BH015 TaxID=2018025 RepID=UPI000CF229F2|nr:SURF1 family protein [Kitasatospora sp. MMS16-BH015]